MQIMREAMKAVKVPSETLRGILQSSEFLSSNSKVKTAFTSRYLHTGCLPSHPENRGRELLLPAIPFRCDLYMTNMHPFFLNQFCHHSSQDHFPILLSNTGSNETKPFIGNSFLIKSFDPLSTVEVCVLGRMQPQLSQMSSPLVKNTLEQSCSNSEVCGITIFGTVAASSLGNSRSDFERIPATSEQKTCSYVSSFLTLTLKTLPKDPRRK